MSPQKDKAQLRSTKMKTSKIWATSSCVVFHWSSFAKHRLLIYLKLVAKNVCTAAWVVAPIKWGWPVCIGCLRGCPTLHHCHWTPPPPRQRSPAPISREWPLSMRWWTRLISLRSVLRSVRERASHHHFRWPESDWGERAERLEPVMELNATRCILYDENLWKHCAGTKIIRNNMRLKLEM